MADKASEYIEEVARSGWWGYGPVAGHLEKEVARYLENSRSVLATSSCTAALHLALLAENIGPGDEVILPAFTYVSTAAVVRFVGAEPVFADIDPETMMLDPLAVRELRTDRTKAVIAVHFAGAPGPFEGLWSWARQEGLVCIEDAAHALGSIDARGRPVGVLADYTAFSFAATKPVPSCSGGLLAWADADRGERVRRLSVLGLTTDTYSRFHDQSVLPEQFVAELGYHYRINDIAAAIAVAQFEEMPRIRALRMILVNRYRQRLEGYCGLGLPPMLPSAQPCWYLMTVRLPAQWRDAIRRELSASHIDTSVHYPNLTASPVFSKSRGADQLYQTRKVSSEIVSLPLFGGMTLDDVDFVCDHLVDAMRRVEPWSD